jgi:hypothetical protein
MVTSEMIEADLRICFFSVNEAVLPAVNPLKTIG